MLLRLVSIAGLDLRLKSDSREVVVQHVHLLSLYLLEDLSLVDHGLLRLLAHLLNGRFHPVLVIGGRLDVQVVKLLLDVLPDFAVLQVGV